MRNFISLSACLVLTALASGINAWSLLFATSQRASLGEPCNQTIRCNIKDWLRCYDGRCGCIKSEEVIYSNYLRKCVLKSGDWNSFTRYDDISMTSCVRFRGSDWICECGNNFYEDDNGGCTPALGHLEVCDLDNHHQCSQYQALECKDGLCQCDRSKAIYSPDFKDPQCVGLAGSPCINSKCTDYAICLANTCVCHEGFSINEMGLCVLPVKQAQNCTTSKDCMQPTGPGQKLVCINGECECDPQLSTFATVRASFKYPELSSEDEEWEENHKNEFEGGLKTQCVGLAGFPCIDRLCGKNAFCTYPNSPDADDDDQGGTCKCMEGYTESKSHSCVTGYNTPCSSSSTCIDDLVCKNSRCQCPFRSQTFDNATKICTSKIGGPCNSTLSCGKNAECKIKKVSGHCVCGKGYVENLDGLCEAGCGTNCSSSTDCDSIAVLQCIDSKCMCEKFSEFNSTLRKCVGLVGAKCNPEEENECIENAECKGVIPFALPGSCMCKNGFKESADYKCKAVS